MFADQGLTRLVFGGSGKRHASAIVIDDTTCERGLSGTAVAIVELTGASS
jgi:hypothetical protein